MTIPNSVTIIESYVFFRCSSLTSVIIGGNVKTIRWHAFANCPELTDVTCYAEDVPSTQSDAFEGSYTEFATLHVPTGSIDAYKTTVPWSDFKVIEGISVVAKGDANGDGVVDVADVVAIVNHILEKPAENFNKAAADINEDGVIDVADVVGVVNIILEKGDADASRTRAVLKENGFIY